MGVVKNQVISEPFHHLGGVWSRGYTWMKKNFRPLDSGFYSFVPSLRMLVCVALSLSVSLSGRVMSFVSLRSQFDITK